MDGVRILAGTEPEPPPPPRPRHRFGFPIALVVICVAAAGLLLVDRTDHEDAGDATLLAAPTEPAGSVPAPGRDALATGWERLVLPWPGELTLVERAADRWLALGTAQTAIGWWSDDGSRWVPMRFTGGMSRPERIRALAENGGRLLAIVWPDTSTGGDPPTQVIGSDDGGRTWTAAGTIEGLPAAMSWTGSGFLAAGAEDGAAAAWTSPDGATWSRAAIAGAEPSTRVEAALVDDAGIALLGGGPDGPIAWRGDDGGYRPVELPPPTGDWAWGRVDLAGVMPAPGGGWLVMTRSRLGGWGRMATTFTLDDWHWQTPSFYADGAGMAVSPGGIVVAGRTDDGYTLGRPQPSGLVAITPGVLGSGTILGVAAEPEGPVVAVGRSLIGGPMIWVHGLGDLSLRRA